MTAQEYILNRLNNLKTGLKKPVVENDDKLYKLTYSKLMSKKFRKLKATEATEEVVERVVKDAIKTKSPIVVSTLFGGNKLWRFEEAPDIDWAELFNLFYYIDWMKTVMEVYPYGAVIDYYSQDISVESLNNVPRSETDNYSRTFRELIEWLKPFLPEGMNILYIRQYEEYDDPSDYHQEIEAGKQAILQQNGGKLPELSEAMKAATELNVKLKPGQDTDSQWREKVELEHQSIFQSKTLGKLFANPNRISLSPTDYEDSNSIITGSTKRSYAKFWAGVGALQKGEAKYNELVLTPKQLETANFEWQDMDIDGLPGKNFKRIRVVS